MIFFTNLRLKIRNFIKKHKNKIIIGIIIWITILLINYLIGKMDKGNGIITTYEPHKAIFETSETVPNSVKGEIEATIEEYITYCNNKEYEKAYNMISQECRQSVYPTLNNFIAYVNYVFSRPKIYNIQNYSNKDGRYFYRVRILDDILKTGLTNEDSVTYFEDNLVFVKKNGKLFMAVKGYIGDNQMEKVYEDKYIKVVLTKKTTTFDSETYTLQITNRTENYILISDGSDNKEITLKTNKSQLQQVADLYADIVIKPDSKITTSISFINFFDEGEIAQSIEFNKIRILESFNNDNEKDNSVENVIEHYKTSISVK